MRQNKTMKAAKQKQSWGPVFNLMKTAKFPWGLYLLSLLIGLAVTRIFRELPMMESQILGDEAGLKNTPLLTQYVLFMVAQMLVVQAQELLNSYKSALASRRLRSAVWKKVIHLPMSEIDRANPTTYASRVLRDTLLIEMGVFWALTLVNQTYSLYTNLMMVNSISTKMMWMLLCLIPFTLLAMLPGRFMHNAMHAQYDRMADYTSYVAERMGSIAHIKAFNVEGKEDGRHDAAAIAHYKQLVKMMWLKVAAGLRLQQRHKTIHRKESLSMKSYVKNPVNLAEELQNLDISMVPGKKEIEEAVRSRLTKGLTTLADLTETDELKKSDAVQLRVESALPRFNKERVTVNLGSGLYDKVLEAELLGKHVGSSGSVHTRDVEVRYTVLSARRKVVPEPTDEMVEAQGREGVHTLAEFTESYGREIQKYAINNAAFQFEQRLIDLADVQVAQEDLDVMAARTRAELLEKCGGEEVPETYKSFYQVETFEELVQKNCKNHDKRLRFCLTSCSALGLAPEGEYDPLTGTKATMELMDLVQEKVEAAVAERNTAEGLQ